MAVRRTSGKTDEDPTPADAYEGDNDGECTDGVDNDRNGLFDCDDPGCAGAPDCDSTGEGEGEATDGDGRPPPVRCPCTEDSQDAFGFDHSSPVRLHHARSTRIRGCSRTSAVAWVDGTLSSTDPTMPQPSDGSW